ncbi:acyl-protein synthetase [Alteromonas facilis]|uniref:LuxE/PaaK family acyltransferase n=1 Tax=Alteromonas facilis TaxID=2048004 RepID=UPI001F0C8967|nr:acyl-protein synthetase [Alteromonas facilis]
MQHTNSYDIAFNTLSQLDVFGTGKQQKQQALLNVLRHLNALHYEQCQEYRHIVDAFIHTEAIDLLEQVPFLAVRLFKLLRLASVPMDAVFKTLQSSGTTSQVTAKVVLDKPTSQRQSKVLVSILQQVIGKQRLPMLIIDAPSTVKGPEFNARAAGIQGLAFFGRDHTYALNDDMTPNWPVIDAFCARYASQPVLIFGFTFMVWRYFIQALEQDGRTLSLPEGILLHSGGWKQLENEKVSNTDFKKRLNTAAKVSRVHNFYGMAEQVGSIFVECSEGYLHAPSYADVIVRDQHSLQPCDFGQQGIIQVISSIPTSYPGHSILTEDVGTIYGEDDCACGWRGKYFSVSGRLPKTEVRGCSDTHAQGVEHAR